jgi:hypothetical protein
MNRKATEVLIRSLLETLNRDFSTNLNPNIIVANSWISEKHAVHSLPGDGKIPVKSETVVMVGASNMRRLIPHIKAAGYEVIDLTQSSWLATPENIEK